MPLQVRNDGAAEPMDVFPVGDGCYVGTKVSSLRFAQRTSQGTHLSLSVHFESHTPAVRRTLVVQRVSAVHYHP